MGRPRRQLSFLISALAQRCGIRFAGTSSCEYRSTAIRRRGSTAPLVVSGARIRRKAQK